MLALGSSRFVRNFSHFRFETENKLDFDYVRVWDMFFGEFSVHGFIIADVKYLGFLFREMCCNFRTNGTSQKQKILRCHYLNGLCYARYDSDPERSIKVFNNFLYIFSKKLILVLYPLVS